MSCETQIGIFNAYDAQGLQTGEGIMRPFLFTSKVSLIHLEIPAGLEVHPHAHPKDGLLYCLAGQLEVFTGDRHFTITRGTAVKVPADVTVGVANKSDESVECLLISAPPTFKSAEELKERIKQYQKQKDNGE